MSVQVLLALVLVAETIVILARQLQHPPPPGERAGPSTTRVVIPLIGFDDDLAANLLPLLTHVREDRSTRWVFALSYRDPSAEPALRETFGDEPNVEIRLSRPGGAPSDKNNNMIEGTRGLTEEFVAFVDIDHELPQGFVGNLREASVGGTAAVTTLNVYADDPFRAAWWGRELEDMFDGQRRYLWGGGMLIPTAIWTALRLSDVLSCHIHDDLPITRTLRRAGVPIEFAPAAMGISHAARHPDSFLSWAHRISVLGRFGLGAAWRRYALLDAARFCVVLWLVMTAPLAASLAIVALAARWVARDRLAAAAADRFPSVPRTPAFRRAIGAAAVFCLAPAIFGVAVLTRRIRYRGIEYSMTKNAASAAGLEG